MKNECLVVVLPGFNNKQKEADGETAIINAYCYLGWDLRSVSDGKAYFIREKIT